MKNAIILHGLTGEREYFSDKYPCGSNSHWIPWAQKQLMINNIKADTPEIPRPFDFNYESWKREVERFDINENTILIGHSMGGGFWLRYLSENPQINISKLVLVAPWLDPEKKRSNNFFDFKIDPSISQRINKIIIFNSDDDNEDIHDSVKIIEETIKTAEIKQFHNYGHFTLKQMGTPEFPELINAILQNE